MSRGELLHIGTFISMFFLAASHVCAELSISLVTIGDPSNVAETLTDEFGSDRTVGRVDYIYEMGKFEITNGQYIEFLNSVAMSDPHRLFEGLGFNGNLEGPIQRNGSDGTYNYSLVGGDENWRNRPVPGITLWQAMRFANWLHNGQPVGAQNAQTTEDGSYTLDGYNGIRDRDPPVTRNPQATWVIPNENEWYKAAYFDSNTGSYFEYPTGSNELPSNNVIDPDPGNNANAELRGGDQNQSIGPPYSVTEVGEFENSASPYGTFDQGGNLWEWTESIIEFEHGLFRIVRGGSYGDDDGADMTALSSSNYWDEVPGYHDFNDGTPGFRVALVPEPQSFLYLPVLISCVTRRMRR